MQLVKRPTCRCLPAVQVLVDRSDAIAPQHLELFVPLICTRCHDHHYMPLGKPILALPRSVQFVMESLLNIPNTLSRHPTFVVADWQERYTHGDGGARCLSVYLASVKHAGFEVSFTWVEDAHSPTSKSKPISADAVAAETMPAMLADVMNRLSSYGLVPTQRGSDKTENWVYLDSSHKIQPGHTHTFRAKLSWPVRV